MKTMSINLVTHDSIPWTVIVDGRRRGQGKFRNEYLFWDNLRWSLNKLYPKMKLRLIMEVESDQCANRRYYLTSRSCHFNIVASFCAYYPHELFNRGENVHLDLTEWFGYTYIDIRSVLR